MIGSVGRSLEEPHHVQRDPSLVFSTFAWDILPETGSLVARLLVELQQLV